MSNNASDKSRAARPKAKNPSGLTSHLGNLAAKSKLDEFRRFFDLKLDVWREFRDRLHRIVYDSFSWPQVQVLDNRHACAEEFLKQWGLEYWGTPENRDKYLMEEHLGSEDFCIYPDHKAVLLEAIVLLLEKDSKNRREQATPETYGTNLPVARSSGPVSAPAVPATSTVIAQIFGTQPDTQGVMENVTLKRTMLATHFLLHDEDGTTGPVCRSFQNYSDATAFLDDMEKALLKNASSAQIYNENPIFQCQYALINLKWSGTTFIMRRGSDDWQALVDRVGCAWTAKANGELNVVEFVIEVKFKN